MVGLDDPEEQLNAVRRFQRWELLRIGICDFFGLLDLRRVTVQLSLLADALVQTCLDHATPRRAFCRRGWPSSPWGSWGAKSSITVRISTSCFSPMHTRSAHWRIGQRLIQALTATSEVGFMYRVDMRLKALGPRRRTGLVG